MRAHPADLSWSLPTRRRRLAWGAALLLGVLDPGCRRGPSSPPAGVDAGEAPPLGLPPGMALPAQQEVRPVYPVTADAPIDPLAHRLCRVLHSLPEERRAACCQASPGAVLTELCARTLSAAVRSGAVKLVAAEVDACAAASQQALAGCDWVGPWPPPMPGACVGILHGTVPQGGRCRSTPECTGTLRCAGAGPTQPGICTPPQPPGQPCGTGVDTLAAYTRQESIEKTRPECEGYCGRTHTCVPTLRLGDACVTSLQCGRTGHCADGTCRAGAVVGLGGACSGDDCADGLRCYQRRCMAPGKPGARCQSDFECLGGCLLPDGGSAGTCGVQCGVR